MANHSVFHTPNTLSIHKIPIHIPLLESFAFSPTFLCGVLIAVHHHHLQSITWGRMLWSYLLVHGLLYSGIAMYQATQNDAWALPDNHKQLSVTFSLACQLLACSIGFMLYWRIGLIAVVLCLSSVVFMQIQAHWGVQAPWFKLGFSGIQGVLGCVLGLVSSNPSMLWPHNHTFTLLLLALVLAYISFTALSLLQNQHTTSTRSRLALRIGTGLTIAGILGIYVLSSINEFWVLLLFVAYAVALMIAVWMWYQDLGVIPHEQSQQTLRHITYTNGVIFSILLINLIFHHLAFQLSIR